MEEGRTKPDGIPKIIKDNLIYEVPLNDCGFSSKALADARYATDLYKNLIIKKINSNKV
jgi:hypothetical protein